MQENDKGMANDREIGKAPKQQLNPRSARSNNTSMLNIQCKSDAHIPSKFRSSSTANRPRSME